MLSALHHASVLEMKMLASPLFGQVNIQGGFPVILGLILAGTGAGLYVLRSTRPELSRDYDIFFSAIGLLCGGILFFQGWRLDPLLQFGQALISGSAIFFAFENIRLRSVTTEQARRNGSRTPIVDDDRDYPVDQVYRAELDEIEPYMEDRPPVRRIRGARDTEAADRAAYRDRYESDDYSADGYSSDAYSSPSYTSRSSRKTSSHRRSRSDRSADYGASAAYDSGYQDDSSYQNSSYQDSSDYGRSSYGSQDRVESDSRSSSSSRRSSRTQTRSDWETPSSSQRSSSRRRSASTRDRYYDDEPAAPRSSRRSSSRTESPASRTDSRRSRSSNDDYVDYKPINDYADRSSSSAYGSRRPSRDYDDEWGAS